MNAYVLSHNGLGDNITMIGAVNFLLQYYTQVYFICKKKYEKNVRLLYNKKVILVTIDENNEFGECSHIIKNLNKEENDIFISGFCHYYVSSHITNKNILNHVKNNIDIKYKHVFDFYNDIGLDTSIYINYFNIPTTELSLDYYNKIKKYNIVFVHTQGSNREIDISNVTNLFVNNNEYIIICPNKNIYNNDSIFYELADTYVNLPIAYYIDIIKKSNEIYVIDSCFSCIVLPLQLSGLLNTTKIKIYNL